ncbi:MAG: HAD family phosphatase [Pseudomonadota bacterium]
MRRAVIFDCDGVLVDSEVLAIRGERRALEALGLVYSPEEYVRRFVGLHDHAFLTALAADYKARLGRPAPANLEDEVLAGRRREMGALTAVVGAREALAGAREAGYRLAVASSARAHFLENKLRKTGLWDGAAPHVYSADLVARGKPAPDIFLYAAGKIGAAPAQCVVIEDSENGVKAGVAAGMTVWGFLGGGHVFDGHGDRLIAAGAARLVGDHGELRGAIMGGEVFPRPA